jgi:hypothetical protein
VVLIATLASGAASAVVISLPPSVQADGPYSPVADLSGPTRLAKTYSINTITGKHELDGQWLGSIVASDGNVYFGSSTHAAITGASLLKYNSATEQVSAVIQDLSLAAGESPATQIPQGKLHSNIRELNGNLYFASHSGNFWAGALNAYTGAHAFRYNLAAGTTTDFRILKTRYSSYAGVAVDPVHNYLYASATAISSGSHRAWEWGQARDDGETFVFSMFSDGAVWEFDPDTFDANPANRSLAFRKVAWVGPNGLAKAIGGDDLYYVQRANEALTNVGTLGNRGPDNHLLCVDIDTGAITDHRRLVDDLGRTPRRTEGMSADAFGHVYLTGHRRLLESDLGTTAQTWRYDDTASTVGTPNGDGNYYEMWRGQYFAVVDLNVPEPASGVALAVDTGV